MTGAAIHCPFGPAGTSDGQFVNNNSKKRLSKEHSGTDAPAGVSKTSPRLFNAKGVASGGRARRRRRSWLAAEGLASPTTRMHNACFFRPLQRGAAKYGAGKMKTSGGDDTRSKEM